MSTNLEQAANKGFDLIVRHAIDTDNYELWRPKSNEKDHVYVNGDVLHKLLGLSIPPGINVIRVTAEMLRLSDQGV